MHGEEGRITGVNEDLTDYKKLHTYLKEHLVKDNVDIYITGSNVHMLSSEIATLLSGRYIQIEMLPLSFKEYMISTGSMNDRGIKYVDYLQNSSFPYTLELEGKSDEIRSYLEGLYNTIVVKDIINHSKISEPMMLKSILKFIFDNIGNPLSSKKIADTMTSSGCRIDTRTVEKYYVVDIGLRLMLFGSSSSPICS